jgi:hypothetical protein
VLPDYFTSMMSLSLLTLFRVFFALKDLATRRMLARYDNTDPLYTLPLPTSPTPTPHVLYALVVTASSSTMHHHLLITPTLMSSSSCQEA